MPGAALRGYGRAYLSNGGPAWTRKEGKSESGGLNQKGRDSYKGGTLKAPTKSKTNPRRKSFCARMGGMKKRLTSAKTARDPNSRINKSTEKVGLLVDPLVIVAKLQKLIQDNLQRVGDTMISGGIDNMEKYQYMLGQARTYQYMLQEISNLLKQKEQKDEQGNVIDIGKGPTKT